MNPLSILSLLLGPIAWLFKFFFMTGWWLVKLALWVTSPTWILAAFVGAVMSFFTGPADAGWFSWGPDPRIKAANEALQRAAQIAADAANVQARQHDQILDAVTALSNERTNLAQQLALLGQLAAKDAAWAAALQTAGPVLIAVAVMALGCAAIWMVTRASDDDSDLTGVLVEEIAGTGRGVLLADAGPRRLLGDVPHDDAINTSAIEHTSTDTPDDQEKPF